MIALYLLLIGVGALLLSAAVFNWEWLYIFDAESAIVQMLGGEIAVRIYWALTGLALILGTILYWLKVW